VDLDGNVSLRGSSDVMILVNGKKSPLMGKSRADVLLPAAGIEKIEVITNPSARFTPEGNFGNHQHRDETERRLGRERRRDRAP